MRFTMRYARLLVCGAGLLAASALQAADKTMMHCFAFTPIETATPADWSAFYAATDAMPKKMPGLVMHVWSGKLMAPMSQFSVDADTRKKFSKTNSEAEGAKVTRAVREYGACFEMAAGADALKKYEAHPYHAEWMKAYEKVRVEDTFTYNLLSH